LGTVRSSLAVLAAAMLFAAVRLVRRRPLGAMRNLLLALVAGAAAWKGWPDHALRGLQFPGARIMAAGESGYGSHALVRTGSSPTCYYNGAVLYQAERSLYEEEAFLPVLATGHGRRILLLGFAPPPLLAELSDTGPDRVVTVFRDRSLRKLFRTYFGKRWPTASGEDFEVYYADPLDWRSLVTGRFTLVILRPGSTPTISGNRLLSASFLARLKRSMTPGGVVCVACDYGENSPDPETLSMLGIIRDTLNSSFQTVTFVAAGKFYFFASDIQFADGLKAALKRLAGMGPRKGMVNSAYLTHVMSVRRQDRFETLLATVPAGPPNGPFSMGLYRQALRRWIREDTGDLKFALWLLFGGLALAALRWRGEVMRFLGAGRGMTLVGAAGFASMAGEILLLSYYQSVNGYIFWRFGALAGTFMVGVAAGSVAALREDGAGRAVRTAAVPLMLCWLAVLGLAGLCDPGFGAGGDWFEALAFCANLAGGAALGAVFTGVVRRRGRPVPRAWAADLYGSALAAFFVPLVVVPFLGCPAAAVLAFTVVAVAAVRAGRLA
jgi:spermidine synthase